VPIAHLCLRAYGYATDFIYGSTTAVAVYLYHVLVAEFLHFVICIVCTGIARIFAVGGALIAVVSY